MRKRKITPEEYDEYVKTMSLTKNGHKKFHYGAISVEAGDKKTADREVYRKIKDTVSYWLLKKRLIYIMSEQDVNLLIKEGENGDVFYVRNFKKKIKKIIRNFKPDIYAY